jgi:hypothetical protein
MTLSVMLDMVVAGLLVATIVYAVLLSRRLGALRNDKEQLEALVRSLDDSVRRAESGIAALKDAAAEIGHELQQRLDRGQALRTDLTYIIDLAGGLADRLEGSIRAMRGDARAEASAEPAPRKRPDAPASPDPSLAGERRIVPVGTADPDDKPRVTGFPSRAERLLRRALEARN